MSALGHKQTFRDAKAMSALPPKADMCSALAHVRFVPIADIEGQALLLPRSACTGGHRRGRVTSGAASILVV